MKKLAVIVFHGIGTYHERAQNEATRFDRRLRDGLRSRLGKRMDELHWQHVLWSDPGLEERQRDVMTERRPPRVWKALFEFVASNLSDATAYNLPKDEGDRGCAYFVIQRMVRSALKRAEADLGGPEAAAATPVLAIAESMGCHVLSCYAWDASRKPERVLDAGETAADLSGFQRLRTLAGLAYMGCNVPLLTMDIARDRLLPIKLARHPAVPGGGFESRWLNFFEGSDPLGYPLAKEYDAYFGGRHPDRHRFPEWERDPRLETMPEDVEVKRRTLLGLTPYAHRLYDRMPSVLNPLAAEITRLLDAFSQ